MDIVVTNVSTNHSQEPEFHISKTNINHEPELVNPYSISNEKKKKREEEREGKEAAREREKQARKGILKADPKFSPPSIPINNIMSVEDRDACMTK